MEQHRDLLSLRNLEDLQKTFSETTGLMRIVDAAKKLGDATATEQQRHIALRCLALLISVEEGTGSSGPNDPEVPQELAETVASVFLPSVYDIASLNGVADAAAQDHTVDPLNLELGLAILNLALMTKSCRLSDSDIMSVILLTSPENQSMTPKSPQLASLILASQLHGDRLPSFIAGPILHAYLRPIFRQSSSKLSTTGRPLTSLNAQENRLASKPPPWKMQQGQIKPIFNWAVKNADSELIAQNWPLFIPVLVTLADDEETAVREFGLQVLEEFLRKCPTSVLESTGVDKVLEETIFPTLFFLPSVTPEKESRRLLRLSYSCLLLLAGDESKERKNIRDRLLDRLLRDGILSTYRHAAEYAGIVEVIMEAMGNIAKSFGIRCVKHLQGLLDIISATTTEPFAMMHPKSMLAAARALNSIATVCWPRLQGGAHMTKIVHIISICWLRLQDDKNEYRTENIECTSLIEGQLLTTASIVESLWNQRVPEPPVQLSDAFAREPRLKKLFQSLDR